MRRNGEFKSAHTALAGRQLAHCLSHPLDLAAGPAQSRAATTTTVSRSCRSVRQAREHQACVRRQLRPSASHHETLDPPPD